MNINTQAQNADSAQKKSINTSYIEKVKPYLAIKLSANNDILQFLVKTNTKSDIRTNDKTVFKLSANYRWLSGSYSYTPGFIGGNKDNFFKGNTKARSFAFNFNFDHWMQELSYTKIRGFYLHNTADYDPNWQKGIDPYIQIPDLVYLGFYGQTSYKFNSNYSFNALNTQTERQLKSAGTFIPAFSYNYFIIDDRVKLTGTNSSQKSTNLSLLLSIRYNYTFVIKKNFYVAPGIQLGGGLITTRLLTRLPAGNIKTNYSNFIYRSEGSLAAGFNGKRFFTGAQIIVSGERHNESGGYNVITKDRVVYHVFAGYRLHAPKFLEKIVDKLDEKKAGLLGKKKK
jgi:hypothetical protein